MPSRLESKEYENPDRRNGYSKSNLTAGLGSARPSEAVIGDKLMWLNGATSGVFGL